ncbi:hypothetical protein SAMN02745911_1195 [Aureimonas altamirensis DSM 21988]|uniref:Uncharacterized protein n=2 Tax=Aureimonas altamirensis TaxID=370622 RepID=A0A0N7KX64_9HYPH|nr:hypothetical protein [Aureimonas altamirensis]SHI79659.1 hypothetical protein SAMN02745911_1195 [Aureimonas altamirensis DSM 21988]
MPCCRCQARREMLATAKAKDGIKGVVKVLPAVGRHMLTNPPKLKRESNGTDRPPTAVR